MKRTIHTLIALLACFVMTVIYIKTTAKVSNKKIELAKNSTVQTISNRDIHKILVQKKEIISHAKTDSVEKIETLDIDDKNDEKTVLQIEHIEVENVDPLLRIEGVDPIDGWQIDMKKIARLKKDDSIWIPAGESLYEVKVSKIEKNSEKSKTIQMNLMDTEPGFGGIMTVSDQTIHMTFDTPEGRYEATVFQGKGMVHRSEMIEAKLMDTKNDDILYANNNKSDF